MTKNKKGTGEGRRMGQRWPTEEHARDCQSFGSKRATLERETSQGISVR